MDDLPESGALSADEVRDVLLRLNEAEKVGDRNAWVVKGLSDPDPARRALAATAELRIEQAYVAWLSAYRDRAVLELRRQGASYDTIAEAMETSKSRVQQIVRRLERED